MDKSKFNHAARSSSMSISTKIKKHGTNEQFELIKTVATPEIISLNESQIGTAPFNKRNLSLPAIEER